MDLDFSNLHEVVYRDIVLERGRAHEKHRRRGNSVEDKVRDNYYWLPILTEELGEVARHVCDGTTNKPAFREELVQLAAMTTAWIDAFDRRDKGGYTFK